MILYVWADVWLNLGFRNGRMDGDGRKAGTLEGIFINYFVVYRATVAITSVCIIGER